MKRSVGSKSRLLISSALLIAILTILNSCSKSTAYDTPGTRPGPKDGPATNEVWIQGMAFSPATITVSAGTTIKWTNKDSAPHTVTSDTGIFESASLSEGGTVSFKFNTVGTFPYHCSIHLGMKASVVVK